MTRADEIRELFAYDRWAADRLLDAASPLSHAQLTRDLGSSFPSVLDTFAHILSSDWVWLRRWHGESPRGRPDEWDVSSLDAVRARWEEVRAERDALLAGLDDEGLDRVVAYRNIAGRDYRSTMAQMLRHVINHATYHRGQIVTLLRQLGATPPATDLIAFQRERTSP